MPAQHIERLGSISYLCKADLPLQREDIDALEAKTGLALPTDYAAFLLAYPYGSVAFDAAVCFDLPNGDVLYIDSWYTVIKVKNCYGRDLLWHYNMYSGVLPVHQLPICDNGGGDLICISCGSGEGGAVSFWDHSALDQSTGRNSYSEAIEIAPSFSSFLGMLYVAT